MFGGIFGIVAFHSSDIYSLFCNHQNGPLTTVGFYLGHRLILFNVWNEHLRTSWKSRQEIASCASIHHIYHLDLEERLETIVDSVLECCKTNQGEFDFIEQASCYTGYSIINKVMSIYQSSTLPILPFDCFSWQDYDAKDWSITPSTEKKLSTNFLTESLAVFHYCQAHPHTIWFFSACQDKTLQHYLQTAISTQKLDVAILRSYGCQVAEEQTGYLQLVEDGKALLQSFPQDRVAELGKYLAEIPKQKRIDLQKLYEAYNQLARCWRGMSLCVLASDFDTSFKIVLSNGSGDTPKNLGEYPQITLDGKGLDQLQEEQLIQLLAQLDNLRNNGMGYLHLEKKVQKEIARRRKTLAP